MHPRPTHHHLNRIFALAALVAMAPLAGCSLGWRMMPTPVAYRDDALDPFAGAAEADRDTTVDILFATDRVPTGYDNPESAYSAKRDTALTLGVATVRLGGKDATWEDVERACRTRRRLPMRITDVREYGQLWTTISIADQESYALAAASSSPDDEIRSASRAFVDEVNARLAAADTDDVVIYVPGFNTPFSDPVYMMAQFEHYAAHDIVCIAYSWPARASPLGYATQMFNARTTVRKLRELLVLLADETNVHRIHLISFSAGAPVLSEAILQLRLMHADLPPDEVHERTRIGHVIFAGADEDLEYVRGLSLDNVGDVLDAATIYMSRSDLAMVLSRTFATGSARLGGVLRDLTPEQHRSLQQNLKISVVDVTGAVRAAGSRDVWSHAYWYLNPWVSTDVIAQIRYGLSPEDRALQRPPDEAIWTFPTDYPDRIIETLRDQRERE